MCEPETKSEPVPANPALVMASSRFPVWLLAALLALVTMALYWPALRCGFVNFDDDVYVTENPHVQSGLTWAGVKWAFGNTQQGAYWAPMMWLSHQLACQVFGLNPWGHHLINVLLHAVNTALVFLLFRRLTGATWRSFFVAALFGWHPLRVESVAWVTERKDVLSTCFGLLALLAYARYVEQSKVRSPRSKVFYGLTLLFFALGLMSKAILVTWPFVMLLLDWWPLQRVSSFKFSVSSPGPASPVTRHPPLSALILEKLPFFALAAVMSMVTFTTVKRGGAVMSIETLPLGARMGNALISYCRYLEKLFWPVDLAVFYPHPGKWPMGEVVMAGGLLVGITVMCVAARRRHPFMLMGWLWFVGTLVPVIELVQSGDQAMADRFTYIPSIGVLIMLIWGAHELTRHWRYQEKGLWVVGGAAVILCLGLTQRQLGYWRDSETLFRHALAVTENNYLAHNNLGDTLLKQGRIDEASRQFQEALRLKPDYADAQDNLGVVLATKGQIDEAIRQFQEALRLKPDYARACNNLGTALDRKGQADEAILQYQEAVRWEPDFAEARYNYGTALDKQGRMDEAISQFQEVIRLKPGHAEAHNNLGIIYLKQGQADEAIGQLQEAVRLKPDFADARYNLGNALGRKGQIDEAIHQFREALRRNPGFAKAHNNLGTVLAMKGQIDEAIGQFQEALRLNPDFAEARSNLAHALALKNAPAAR
jgi:protein O-mannosyl-transferase